MERLFLLRKEHNQPNYLYGTFVQNFNGTELVTTEEITDSNMHDHIGDAMRESVNIYDTLGVRYKVESIYLDE